MKNVFLKGNIYHCLYSMLDDDLRYNSGSCFHKVFLATVHQDIDVARAALIQLFELN